MLFVELVKGAVEISGEELITHSEESLGLMEMQIWEESIF